MRLAYGHSDQEANKADTPIRGRDRGVERGQRVRSCFESPVRVLLSDHRRGSGPHSPAATEWDSAAKGFCLGVLRCGANGAGDLRYEPKVSQCTILGSSSSESPRWHWILLA